MFQSTIGPRAQLSCVLLAIFTLFVPTGLGQSSGTISGTVSDESGAVLPGAEITITHLETSRTRDVIANDSGRYSAPQLALGTYEVRAALPGFRSTVRRGIELTLGREAIVDLTLSVGELAAEVIVTGEAPLVESTSSEISRLVSSAQIQDLPLQGRNLAELVVLQTGVVEVTSAQITSTTAGLGKKFAIGGARPNQSTFLLDGGDINNSTNKGVGGASGLWLGSDTIREFTVLTSNYNASYGKALGGVIIAASKSGTNQLHGSAFWLHRNDNMDARNFFDRDPENPTVRNDPPEFRRHQFGFTLGGPIVPDKTFFFGSFEGFREAFGTTHVNFTPTAEARVGADPAILPILDLYPLPNGADIGGGRGEFLASPSQPTEEDYFMFKVDHNFSENDSVFFRYTIDDSVQTQFTQAQAAWGYPLDLGLRNQYATFEHTHLFSATLLNVARFSFNRSRYFALPVNNPPALIFAPGRPFAGSVDTSGLPLLGNHITTPFDIPVNNFDYSDDLTITTGRHNLTFGFLARRMQENISRDFRASGQLTFGSLEDLINNNPNRYQGPPGVNTSALRGWRQWLIGFYVQDDFNLTPRLTLNLGLRYEFITNPTEVNGLIATVTNNWDTDDLETGVVVDNIFLKNPSLNNWAPRLGMAWDPFGDGKTAIRAGVGLFYDQIIPVHYDVMQWMPPFFDLIDTRSPLAYPNPLGEDPSTFPRRLSPYNADYYNEKTGTSAQWNVSIQREFFESTVVEAAYVGNKSWNLPVAVDPNSRVPEFDSDGRIFFGTGPRRNPNWGRLTIIGWEAESWYDSLQLRVQNRLTNGLRLGATYTWSKALDQGSNTIGADSTTSNRQRQNTYDINDEKGLSGFHTGNRFTMNFNYDLPVRGLQGAAGALLNNWQIGGIVKLSDGPFFTTDLGSSDWSRSRIGADRPNLIAGGNNNPVNGVVGNCNPGDPRTGTALSTPTAWFDPCQFELQERGYFGDLGKTTIEGPGLATFDLSLNKGFDMPSVSEDFSLQFRAEFFNVLNHTNFGQPSGSAVEAFNRSGNRIASVGRITRTVTSSRQVQLSLKLLF